MLTGQFHCSYINPHATEKQILYVDHIAIVVCGLASPKFGMSSTLKIPPSDGVVMGVLGLIFFYAGISMGEFRFPLDVLLFETGLTGWVLFVFFSRLALRIHGCRSWSGCLPDCFRDYEPECK